MKNNKQLFIFCIIQLVILFVFSSCSNENLTEVNHSFKVAINAKESVHDFDKVEFKPFDDLNLGFFKGEVWIKLEIQNEVNEDKSYMFISNDRFSRNYVFYKLDTLNDSIKLVNHIKDSSKQDFRTFNNPNPNLKLDLQPNEHATYLITSTSDGRTKDATPKIITLESYLNFVNDNTFWNIIFYGVISCLLLINFYQWNLYKQKIYFYYIFYLVSTILVYLGIEGYLFHLRLKHTLIDHFIFICIKLWALSLIMYTSKFLDIETVAPKYYRFIKQVLGFVLGSVLVYQFAFYYTSIQHLHYFENVLSFLWLFLIIGILLLSGKTKRLELKYYLIPLGCFIFFTAIGLIDVHFQFLPGNAFTYVKIGAIVELIGFTYFMKILITKKIKESELLEKELLENRKKLQEKDSLLSRKTNITKTDLVSVFKLLENPLSSQSEWDKFKLHLNELDPTFLEHLLNKYPNLSKSEIRLLILFKIGYSQKEISSILNIAPDSVKKAKNRVRKRLNIPESTHLDEFLIKF